MNVKGRILLLDDDELIISMLARLLGKEGYATHTLRSADNAIETIMSWQPDLVLLDIDLREEITGLDLLRQLKEEGVEFPIVMLTSDDSREAAIKALRFGAADYQNKPFNFEELKIVIEQLLANARIHSEISYLKQSVAATQQSAFIGESPAILSLLNNARKIAQAGVSSVLITGKSGTGKEVLARQIHQWRLADKIDADKVPFIAINCTALPENLIEGELFGHVKGAFTDAKADKKGVFELANGGTLLLDEIGDMRPDLQAKLLRVLEERTVRRVGGKVDLPIDVTIIACTNRNLKEQVQEGIFREDLFYRLNSFTIDLPPLKERGNDVLLLAGHFLNSFAVKYNKKPITTFSPEARELLTTYAWPGNVRELRNLIERCVVMEDIDILTTEHLPLHLDGHANGVIERRKNFQLVLPDEGISLEKVERELLRQALERTNNNMTKSAKLLDMTYDAFRYQIKKHRLD